MKELEIVSHFKASFFKKNLRSRIFSYICCNLKYLI